MVGIIETILSVGKVLFGLRGDLAKARQSRKQQVADYLAAVAQTIEETSALLRQGVYPAGKCQELLMHSQNMEAAIGDLVGDQQATELGTQLREVSDIERLYGELAAAGPSDGAARLTVLDQAAGYFRATASFVKVSP